MMKRIFLILAFVQFPLIQYGQIIADHTVVDKFDDIPAYYIAEVKKMLFIPAGESHSNGILGGLALLEALDPTYNYDQGDGTGGPDPYTETKLRAERVLWGDYSNETGWITMYGEEDWFTNATGIARTKAGITYVNTNGWNISAIGMVWCWDMIGASSSGTDPEFGCHWFGSSLYGPEGSKPWGLNAADYSITGNSVCMDSYLNATQDYMDYCSANEYNTKIFFATGPVDPYGSTEERYQAYIKHEYIRNFVKANSSRILFDYADILCYDDNGALTTETWSGHTYPVGTVTNTTPEQVGHISNTGALRLGKAVWWMLARIAGWDGGSSNIPVNTISVSGQGGAAVIATDNGTLQLTATVSPEDATNKTVTWSIINGTGEALINSSGLVTAVRNGTVTARATANDGSQVYGSLVITISNQVIPVSSITVSGAGGSSTIVTDNGTLQLLAAVSPDEATNKNVSWSLINGSGEATINSAGLVTAVRNGTVTARATATDGSGVYGSFVITISNQVIPVTGITVTGAGGLSVIVTDNGTLQLTATVTPSDATVSTVTWSITNGTGEATISNAGLVTAIRSGTVTARATANDGSGIYGTLVISISNQVIPVSGISVTGAGGSSIITSDKGTLQLTATISPADASNQSVSWSLVNGTGEATISSEGLVSAIRNGTVTARATANDGSGVYGTITITISNQIIPVTGIVVSGTGGSSVITNDNGTLQLTAAVSPSDATISTVTWSIINGTGSATINGAGLVSALTNGTVTARATANDGSGVFGSLVITISGQIISVSSITVTGAGGSNIITTDNGTLQLSAAVLPSNASNQTVTWSVTVGTGEAMISSSGMVTAVRNGTVTAMATANDGSGVFGTMTITITNQVIPVTGISVTGAGGSSVITTDDGTLQLTATVTPSDATISTVTWSVTNGTGSAMINGSGLVTALTNGTVTARATSNDGSGVSGTYLITISNQVISVTGITVTGEGGLSVIASDNGTLQLTAAVFPSNATVSSVTWSVTSGSGSASITGSGLVTALTNGTVTARANANDGSGIYGTLIITISNQVIPVTGINVTGAGGSSAINVDNGTLQLSAAVSPFNATISTVTWSVTNGSGSATINGTGLVTALTNGTVTARATANDGSGIFGTLVINISNQVIPVTGITITGAGGSTTISSDNGTLQLTASVTPSDATISTVTWSVTNGTGSATINGAGLVTALTNGTVTARATSNDGSGVSGTIVITISNQVVPVSSITIAGSGGSSVITTDNGTLQLSATVLPADASNTSVTWSLTNGTGEAVISTNGLVTAVRNGTVTARATANDGSGVLGTLAITISNQVILVSAINVSGTGGSSVIATDNGTLQLIASITPSDASNTSVTWSLVNGTGEAIISSGGLVTALRNGTVTARATANDGTGVQGTLLITISNQVIPVSSITVTGTGGSTTITSDNGTLQLTATVLPSDASNSSVTWSVSNGTGEATINSSGLVTASRSGTITARATANDGSGAYGSLAITITNQVIPVAGISVTGTGGSSVITTDNGTLQLIATVTPSDASNSSVTWSLVNGTGEASISSGGLVTAFRNGTVTARATANDGSGIYGTLTITISNQVIPVTAVTVTGSGGSSVITTDNGTLQLASSVLPSDASNITVTWSLVNGTGEATISPSGLVTAIRNGTVTARATANDGSGISGTLTITISNQVIPVTGIIVTGAGGSSQITSDNGTLQLSAAITPSDASNSSISWSIVNGTGEATISLTGMVTAVKNGTVTARAIANDGTGIFGSLLITISNQIVPVTSITITGAGGSSVISTDNGTLQLNAVILPSDATNSSVTWSISNGSGEATISSGGLVTSIRNGTVTARAVANDGSGVYGTLVITITNQVIPVTGITITGAGGSSVISTDNGMLQLSAAIMPADASNSTVTWSLINGTGEATISSEGLVTAVRNGSVTARAIANDGSGVNGSLVITISNQIIPVAAITVTGSGGLSAISSDDGSLQLTASVLPVDASNATVNWSLTNVTGEATISPTGLVTAIRNGTVTARATANDGSGVTGTLIITITNQIIPVSSINVAGTGGSAVITIDNGTLLLSATISPADASNNSVSWSLTNGTGEALINSSGLVTAIRNGTVTARATANDGTGVYGTLVITISNQVIPVTGITITGAGGSSVITTDNGALQLSATVMPADASNSSVTWSLINGTGEATISSSGLVSAIRNGTVTARATANDGTGVYGTLVITISNQVIPVTAITITGAGGSSSIISDNGTLQLAATITPADASNATVSWSLVNGTGEATISSSGNVTALRNGTVTVTATANDGSGVSGNFMVTISNQVIPVSGINVTGAGGSSVIATDNGTLQLTATVAPSDASDPSVSWSVTNNTGEAVISPSGLVTAVSSGTVTARAEANDGSGIYGTMIITITNQVVPVTTITVNGTGGSSVITTDNGTLQLSATVAPTDATVNTVTWSLVNGTGEATISTAGLVTAFRNGAVTARATANDGSGIYGTLEITVSNQIIPVTAITVTGAGGSSSISSDNGILQLSATITPTDASNLSVNWSVINGTGEAEISPAGLVTALRNGTVTARAVANDGSGVYGTMLITISNQVIPVSSINVTGAGGSSVITTDNGTLQLTAAVLPTDASVTTVTWSLVNGTGEASISPGGLVTAIKNGTVTARATANDGSGIFGTMIITISNQVILITAINVTGPGGSSVIASDNGTLQLTAAVLPADASNTSVNWSMVNGSGEASISSGGLVTAIRNGTVTARATANDGSGISGTLVITISNQVIPVSGITVTGAGGLSVIVIDNGTLQLTTTVTPADATISSVTWSIMNGTGQAAISPAGMVSAQRNGTVTARATANDGSGVYGILVITISNQVIPVSGITVTGIGGSSVITTDNGTLQLSALITPSDASNSSVLWSLTNGTGEANINPSGLVAAVRNGTVTARATANDGSGVTGTLVITISNQVIPVSNISVTGAGGSSIITTDNGTLQLTAQVSPVDASNSTVSWSITNGTGEALINHSGVVMAVRNGTVIARATANDGSGIQGTLVITISNQVIPVTGITVSGTGGATVIATDNGSLQLIASLSPSDASNSSVSWSLINGTGEAIISSGGLVTAVRNGTVTARATANDGSGVYGTMVITISNQVIPVSSINVTGAGGSSVITTDNGSLQLSAAILPSDASNTSVTWSLTNGTGEATVNPSGLLTAIRNGTVTARATANDGSGVTGTLVITISNQVINVSSISVTGAGGSSVITTDNGTLQLSAAVSPADASNNSVAWSLVNGTGQATINSSGLVTALRNGTVTARATANDGSAVTGSLVITISNQVIPVTGISITGTGGLSAIVTDNGTLQLIANVTPADATISSVVWTVINGTGSATINGAGLLTAVSDGTVTARATANDGSGVYGSIEITISNQIIPVSSVIVTGTGGSSVITTDNGTLQLVSSVVPDNATNKSLTWSLTNNTGQATISSAGLVTAVRNGTVTARASANDGSAAYGTMIISISNQVTPVTGISVAGAGGISVISTDNGTLQLSATVTPADASNTTVSWTITNGTGEAIISSTGLVTAVRNGTVTARAVANDGSGISGTMVITITNQIISVTGITVTGSGGQTTILTDNGFLQLLAVVEPVNATNQVVTWSIVNNTGEATITAGGLVTAVRNGTVTARATASDGSGVYGTLVITISNQVVPVTGIIVTGSGGSSTITTDNGALQLTATLTPSDATISTVTWTITNGSGSATINGAGLVTALKNGTVTARAMANDGSGVYGILNITISNQLVPVTGITVTGPGGNNAITSDNGTLQLNATIEPADASNSSVTWSIVNGTGEATIGSSGLVTAIRNGTVTARATANDGSGVYGIMVINISNQVIPVGGITVTGVGGVTIINTDDGTLQLIATVTPSDATISTVTWSITGGTGTAIINGAGLVSAVTNGSVTARATANDGSGVYGSLTLTITNQIVHVSGLTVAGAGGLSAITSDNGTLQLTAYVLPVNATNQTVTWSMINGTGEATISSSGLVTAIKNGTVTARAAANDGSGIYGSLTITISNQVIPVSGISVAGIGGSSVINTDDGTLQLTAMITPSDATISTVTWSLTNGSGSATINGSGLVTALTNGTVTARATANDGSGIFGTLVITITSQIVPVTGITVTGAGGSTVITSDNGTLQLIATLIPATATNKTVTWSVVNGTGEANINASGLVTAVRSGTITARATANDGSGVTGTLAITISNQVIPVTGITVTGPGGASVITTDNGTLQLTAALIPSDATIGTVTWSVTNGTGSASISTSGLVTAITNGTVTVRATANDGSGVYGTLLITISNQIIPVSGITVAGAGGMTAIITDNGTLQLEALVIPSDATNREVFWTIINGTGEAFISSTGLVTAVRDGTVTARATASDGSGVFGSMFITISNQFISVTGITVTAEGGLSVINNDDGTLQLSASISPSDASVPSVIWSLSDDTGEATISSSGLVTAIANGIVTARATATDGSGVSGTLIITITNQVTPVTEIIVSGAGGLTVIPTVHSTLQLTADILPENATIKSVTWSVINLTGEAKITSKGLLYAIKEGTVAAQAAANDGSAITGTLEITIKSPVAKIIVNESFIEVQFDDDYTGYQLSLHNFQGQLLDKKTISGDICRFDISLVPNGAHMIVMSKSLIYWVGKVVVCK